jgi:hypothetical protein
MNSNQATVREWLDAATAGSLANARVEKYADAHLYIGQRLLRLWDVPIESVAPADVFSAEWIDEEDAQ